MILWTVPWTVPGGRSSGMMEEVMTLEELEALVEIQCGETVLLVHPPGWKAPKGWPRGELMCVNSAKESVKRYSRDRLAKWLKKAKEG